jgi:hypothetical protein
MPRITVRALQLNLEGLLKLLGGTPDDRLRFWEILKGITTPAQAVLINKQIAKVAASVKTAQVNAQALSKSVKTAGKTAGG